MPASLFPRDVVDEAGHVHRLAPRPLGQGGQGAVFRPRDEQTAVKLLTDGLGTPLRDPRARDRLRRRIDDVRLLPLAGLRLAAPLGALAEPYAGYVMRLMTGMVPARSLLASPRDGLAEFYLATGGLRRRLRLLAAAEMLALLHAVPAVFADLSPNNLFVSRDAALDEVWLIDADNLHIAGSSRTTIHTPGFGAPEVVRGESGANTLTDTHAFAVLAFLTLVQQHPFFGDLVEDGGDWGSGEDLEAQALAGVLPWIHDESDARNTTEQGIFPREIVLSTRLRELFQAAFGPGKTEPAARPGLAIWAEALHQAADLTVPCPACSSTYYFNAPGRRCPWCDAPLPAFVHVESHVWDPELDDGADDVSTDRKVLPDPEPPAQGSPAARRSPWPGVCRQTLTPAYRVIRRRMVAPTSLLEGDAPALEVEFGSHSLTVRPTADGEYHVLEPGKACEPLGEARSVRLDRMTRGRGGLFLHCGPLDRPHRLLSFQYIPEGRP